MKSFVVPDVVACDVAIVGWSCNSLGTFVNGILFHETSNFMVFQIEGVFYPKPMIGMFLAKPLFVLL